MTPLTAPTQKSVHIKSIEAYMEGPVYLLPKHTYSPLEQPIDTSAPLTLKLTIHFDAPLKVASFNPAGPPDSFLVTRIQWHIIEFKTNKVIDHFVTSNEVPNKDTAIWVTLPPIDQMFPDWPDPGYKDLHVQPDQAIDVSNVLGFQAVVEALYYRIDPASAPNNLRQFTTANTRWTVIDNLGRGLGDNWDMSEVLWFRIEQFDDAI